MVWVITDCWNKTHRYTSSQHFKRNQRGLYSRLLFKWLPLKILWRRNHCSAYFISSKAEPLYDKHWCSASQHSGSSQGDTHCLPASRHRQTDRHTALPLFAESGKPSVTIWPAKERHHTKKFLFCLFQVEWASVCLLWLATAGSLQHSVRPVLVWAGSVWQRAALGKAVLCHLHVSLCTVTLCSFFLVCVCQRVYIKL